MWVSGANLCFVSYWRWGRGEALFRWDFIGLRDQKMMEKCISYHVRAVDDDDYDDGDKVNDSEMIPRGLGFFYTHVFLARCALIADLIGGDGGRRKE